MSFSTDVLRCVGKYTWGKKFTPVNRVTFIDNAVYLLNLDSGEATGADESAVCTINRTYGVSDTFVKPKSHYTKNKLKREKF